MNAAPSDANDVIGCRPDNTLKISAARMHSHADDP